MKHIGPAEEGKIEITASSHIYGGINSSSILEPFMRLYRLTEDKRYLRFGEYILKSGGAAGHPVFTYAFEGKKAPYEYGVGKAYEMISCFEGLIEYYRITGNEDCRKAAINFYTLLRDTDRTVIGCCGTDTECLNHATVEQANPYICKRPFSAVYSHPCLESKNRPHSQ